MSRFHLCYVIFFLTVLLGVGIKKANSQEFNFGEGSCKEEVLIDEESLFYPFCIEEDKETFDEGPKSNKLWIVLPPGCAMVVVNSKTQKRIKMMNVG